MDTNWKSQAVIIGTEKTVDCGLQTAEGEADPGLQSAVSTLQSYLPNPQLTPGSIVCINDEALFANAGYAETNRDVSRLTKHRVFRRYNIAPKHRHLYHIDHLIPLSLGGSNDIRNLWPHQHHETHGPTAKARLEAKLRNPSRAQHHLAKRRTAGAANQLGGSDGEAGSIGSKTPLPVRGAHGPPPQGGRLRLAPSAILPAAGKAVDFLEKVLDKRCMGM